MSTYYGRFINRRGFTKHQMPRKPLKWWQALLRPFCGSARPVYEVTLDPCAPLTWEWPSGVRWQIDRHSFSDGGSIPWIGTGVVGSPDWFELPYLYHDNAYCIHGVYEQIVQTMPYEFRRLTQAEADDALRQMILAEAGWPPNAATIWAVLRLVGCAAWRRSFRNSARLQGRDKPEPGFSDIDDDAGGDGFAVAAG